MKNSDLKIQNNFPSMIIILFSFRCKIKKTNELFACCIKHAFSIRENKKFNITYKSCHHQAKIKSEI